MESEKRDIERAEGEIVSPENVPEAVADRLGFRCVNCGSYNNAYQSICPKCVVLINIHT